ncbi:MAG: hypothetical protein ACD_3C00111G0016 [uncultured bacterium (gcode 4)]|uniref:Uncharacterized protein n=1 Tax=uncultured bacterium (gcode 4) TaxID=1234023 RepID=K2GCP0_9BACT|nr:MAG: hypothetical protein ACD_3C00111G0016 [uncultured bacterium (gcode 4)]
MEKQIPSQSAIKQTAKNNLKTQFNFNRTVGSIWIVAIENEKIRNFLLEWISEIWLSAIAIWKNSWVEFKNIAFLDKINSNSLQWFDFFVYDNEMDGIDVVKFMWAWIVPIMPVENTYSWMIKDFNPMKFEWNWFLWKSDSAFCIFEKIISYIENIKFPEDKRVLLKNVTTTF